MVLSIRSLPGTAVCVVKGLGAVGFNAIGLSAFGLSAIGLSAVAPVLAGPVVCSTTIEAPAAPLRGNAGGYPAAPVEVTRCGEVRSPSEVMNRAFFSWSTPFARGQDLTHQFTDLFGIAMGGGDGTKVMGLGFGDQQIMWSVSAMENVTEAMLDSQSRPMPLRTADMPSFYSTSLGTPAPRTLADSTRYRNLASLVAPAWNTPVRALW